MGCANFDSIVYWSVQYDKIELLAFALSNGGTSHRWGGIADLAAGTGDLQLLKYYLDTDPAADPMKLAARFPTICERANLEVIEWILGHQEVDEDFLKRAFVISCKRHLPTLVSFFVDRGHRPTSLTDTCVLHAIGNEDWETYEILLNAFYQR